MPFGTGLTPRRRSDFESDEQSDAWISLLKESGEKTLLDGNCRVLEDELGKAAGKAFSNELGSRINKRLNTAIDAILMPAFRQTLSDRLKGPPIQQLQPLSSRFENSARQFQAKAAITLRH